MHYQYMGNESVIGKIARFWSPNNNGSKPDIEGGVVEDHADGRIVVDERGERVTVNMHGGWLRHTFTGVLLAAGAYVVISMITNTDYA